MNRDLDKSVARLLGLEVSRLAGKWYAGDDFLPFYHKDDGLARAALEQVCDERGLVAVAKLWRNSIWTVNLQCRNYTNASRGEDKSFPLAICKALAGLENKK